MKIEPAWARITNWLRANLPEVLADFNRPASAAELSRAESALGITFPQDFASLYSIVNGQKGQSRGAIFGEELLSLERILFFCGAYAPTSNDAPARVVPSSLPFAGGGGGGFIGIDLNAGQVVNLGRYAIHKTIILADSLGEFLRWVANELERGKGRVYESSGLKLFDHADLGDVDFEEGLAKLFDFRRDSRLFP